MNPDEKKELDEVLEFSKENNKLLKKINRSIQWGRFVTVLYWLIIIGSAVGAYYFLQPVFEAFKETLGSFSGGIKSIERAGSSLPDFDSLLQQLNVKR